MRYQSILGSHWDHPREFVNDTLCPNKFGGLWPYVWRLKCPLDGKVITNILTFTNKQTESPFTSLLDVYISTINNINRGRTEHIFSTWLYSFPREYRFIFMASFDSPVYTDPQTFFAIQPKISLNLAKAEGERTRPNTPSLL